MPRRTLFRRLSGALDLIGAYARYNLQMDMEYRASFLTQVFGMVLNDALWIVFWWIFFDRFQVVAGWGLRDVMVLFGVLTTGFGLAVGMCGNVVRLSRLIAEGHLDYYLAVPKPVLLHALVSRGHASAWGDAIFGVAIFFISGAATLPSFAFFIVGSLLAAMTILSFCIIVHSLAFWLGNAEGLAGQLVDVLLTFSSYPATIFKGWARVALFTIIPAGFISTVPVRLVQALHWPFLAGFIAFAAAFTAFAVWVFYRGLRRYESGNLINLRT